MTAAAPAGSAKRFVTAHGDLMPSSTLQDALLGRVVPAVGDPTTGVLISASTPGVPSVGEDGSASYRIPIWVPDGINGLQPNLAVEYNSEGGVGLLGPRWRLTGISTITRCRKTRAQDGVQTGIDFFGDTFCLDGQRMVRLPGTDEFRMERETFVKIVGFKNGSGDFTSFKEYQRDGLIRTFGQDLGSRLHGNAQVFGGSPTRDVAYAYYVSKVEDRYGNSMLFSYGNVSTATTGVGQVQELVPTSIYWGATGNTAGLRSVGFEYQAPEAVPLGTVDTAHMRWVHGLGIGAAQLISRIVVYGPNENPGTSVMLKQYRPGYTIAPKLRVGGPGTQIITGDFVLANIGECDSQGPSSLTCKKLTSFEWEGGALTHTKVDFGVADAAFANSGYWGDTSNQYERIMAADLNNDGRDDIVYRSYISPHHSGFLDCVGWNVRQSQFAPGVTSGIPYLTSATPLSALGSDPDTSCRAYLISSTEYKNAKPPNAYIGDISFADFNGDGLLDILSPIGKSGTYDPNSNVMKSTIVGYRAYFNSGSTGTPTFGNPINFLESIGQLPSIANFSTPIDATLAVGDIDGDGLPEVVTKRAAIPHFRSATLSGAGLVSKTETRGGQTFPYSECTSSTKCKADVNEAYFSDGTNAAEHLQLIDIDGDGTAEILRNANCPTVMSCGAMNSAARVISPTMNGAMPFPAGTTSSWNVARWFVDLNGDGLPDLVFLSTGNKIFTSINTGAGFAAAVDTGRSLPGFSLRSSGSVMVTDYNLDGRQDLFIYGAKTVLLSDGKGGLTQLDTGIPAGKKDLNARQNLVADLNGDGLPDIVELEGTVEPFNDNDHSLNAPSPLVAYIRDGKAPLMVTAVTEGTGRSIAFNYDFTGRDAAFYAPSAASTCNTDPQHLECLKGRRWLTQSLTISGPDVPAAITQTFKYRGGVSDRNGRGFLGFTQRDIYGPGSRHETVTYDPLSRVNKPTGVVRPYVYSFAMMPLTRRVDADTPQGPNRHHYVSSQYRLSGGWQSNGTFLAHPYEIDTYNYDCPSTSGGSCTGTARSLGSQTQIPTFDAYGNLIKQITYFYDTTGGAIRTDTDVTNYKAADTTNWLVNLLDPAKPSTRTSLINATGKTVTRTVKFTPDTVHGGLLSVELEPNGDATTHLTRSFVRDPRGRLSILSEAEVATGLVRNTELFYEDADGVYVTTIRKDSGNVLHRWRYWRHPGFGFVVEVDGPDGTASSRSYDTLGRLLSKTEASGSSMSVSYQDDNLATGASFTVMPEGSTSRGVKVRLDSFGREILANLARRRDAGGRGGSRVRRLRAPQQEDHQDGSGERAGDCRQYPFLRLRRPGTPHRELSPGNRQRQVLPDQRVRRTDHDHVG